VASCLASDNESNVREKHEDEIGRLIAVGALLEGHVVAGTKDRYEMVSDAGDQAVVNVRPEVGVLEVGVHARKRRRHLEIRPRSYTPTVRRGLTASSALQ